MIAFIALTLPVFCFEEVSAQHRVFHVSTAKKKAPVADSGTYYSGYFYISNPPFQPLKTEMIAAKDFRSLYLKAASLDTTALDIYTLGVATNSRKPPPARIINIHRYRSKNWGNACGQFVKLKSMRFEKGTAIFSGSSAPATVHAKETGILRQHLKACRYGAVITLVDCLPLNDDGSYGLPVNQVIEMK